MASKSGRGAKDDKNGDRSPLPFEPGRDRKKASKADRKAFADQSSAKSSGAAKSAKASKSDKTDGISARAQARVDEIRASNRKKAEAKAAAASRGSGANASSSKKADGQGAIPAAVSKRMLRRMAVLSLSPIALGVGIFFLSYYLLSQEIIEFAPVVVLLTTMGCFGLGVVGLSYGMLSASWDEAPGSLVGMDEFKLNLGRMKDAWKESRQSKT
ncbi:PAM68 family protein [cf. Phormidesmis sp. LEGE 11477]|uniref:PAM68 family protein n=1 Tax=cf. Phormidesmis sp. LEGE 11477 TaxID=1828680 RepID=UPI001880D294|nr:PAM68 family protein [cf. Phormidesmis sp. LEGE 11477]MBE9063270.1 PAM68 family protein [cf. Phormidesmis sp. LEGE 11477]